MKSLEDTIRDVQKRFKNRPSILKENSNMHFIPQQNSTKQTDIRNMLVGDFRPPNTNFR
jgi:hypothetical protein